MARPRRTVVVRQPHHVVQRGNRRQTIFFSDEDRIFYLNLLRSQAAVVGVAILAYCLMPNHVHLVLVPSSKDSLSRLMNYVQSRYAIRINTRLGWTGHLWHSRFYSNVMDDHYLLQGVRYVELNPVRAKLVDDPGDYYFCSAHARLHGRDDPYIDATNEWMKYLPRISSWREFLNEALEVDLFRRAERQNLPIGTEAFIEKLETQFGRSFRVREPGRPRRGTTTQKCNSA